MWGMSASELTSERLRRSHFWLRQKYSVVHGVFRCPRAGDSVESGSVLRVELRHSRFHGDRAAKYYKIAI